MGALGEWWRERRRAQLGERWRERQGGRIGPRSLSSRLLSLSLSRASTWAGGGVQAVGGGARGRAGKDWRSKRGDERWAVEHRDVRWTAACGDRAVHHNQEAVPIAAVMTRKRSPRRRRAVEARRRRRSRAGDGAHRLMRLPDGATGLREISPPARAQPSHHQLAACRPPRARSAFASVADHRRPRPPFPTPNWLCPLCAAILSLPLPVGMEGRGGRREIDLERERRER